jgi:hypothetical protein
MDPFFFSSNNKMREDIRKKRNKKIYKDVERKYCEEFKNIRLCCKELNITPSTYYKVCKELGKQSVGTDKNIQKAGKNNLSKSKTNKNSTHTDGIKKINQPIGTDSYSLAHRKQNRRRNHEKPEKQNGGKLINEITSEVEV